MATEKTDNFENINDLAAPENSGENEYYIFDKRFYRIDRSNAMDEVDGVYQINIKNPLPELDSSTAKAYSVSNKHDKGSNGFYAVILDKKYPIRLEEINKLIGQTCPNFTNIVAAQLIRSSLGVGSFFAVIIQKPVGITLREYVQKNREVKEDFIARELVPQVSGAISFLAKKGMVHGRINLDTVYIDDNDSITVGECVSDVCGASQKLLYENINRAAAMAMGKGNGVVGNTDYYALGVIAAIMLRGKNPVEGISDGELLERKFAENTYRIVADGFEFSPHTMDFLRGVINDKNKEVWSSKHVEEWIKGRSFNLLPPAESVEAGRPIVFNSKKYVNKKYLAHALYMHWDEARKFIREDVLIRWIERSVLDKALAEKLEILSHRSGGDTTELFDRDDELLAQYIMLLDPYGPIRIKGFSAMLDGVGPLLAYGYANDKKHYLNAVENIIMFSLPSYMSMEKMDNNIKDSALILQRCLDLIRKKDIGFGLERCLYELNVTLPCQSPVLFEYNVFTMQELLKVMDTTESISHNIVDRHAAALLSSRLELPNRIRITSLTRFADFATNLHVQMLSLLSLAQETSGLRSLDRLSAKVIEALKNVVEDFHSKYVREDINKDLARVARKGSLPDILKVITDTQYLVRDRLGFRKAVTRYRNNTIQIMKLSNRKAINNMGYRYGLHLSVLLSFFIVTVVIIVLTLKAF